MNEHEPPNQDDLRDAWMESLLGSVSKPEDHADRIARAIDQIEPSADCPNTVKPSVRNRSFLSHNLLRWSPIGIAAAIVLGLFLVVQYSGSQRTAHAAIQRSLAVAAQTTPRKYRILIDYRPIIGESRVTENELYVDGNNRFAMQHPGMLPGTSFWIGHDDKDAWVVPIVGPVLKGDRSLLGNWLSSHEEVDTPYLHVTTMLNRMARGYELETLDDVEVTTERQGVIPCQHILARRSMTDIEDYPTTIELWASRNTGMAVRLVARWKLAEGEVGRRSVELTFLDEVPAISDDWFTAEGHYEGFRPVIQTNAMEDGNLPLP